MKEPLVTVITVTHNRANLISRAIKSVINQTYKNIEYIIVDGASKDNTDEVVNSFKDKRLNYIKLEENLMPISCINIAVEKSHGDFFTFLDDDDEYLPERIEKAVLKFNTLDDVYGMVYCWMTYFDNTTKKMLREHKPSIRGFVGDEVVEKPLVSGTPTYTFRRDVFLELKGWRTDIGIASDWELAARCCQKWRVDFVPESLVNVYENHGFVRMSEEKKYYENRASKSIVFHNHFLTEFAHVFNKYPERAYFHYEALFYSYLIIKQRKVALGYWLKCLKLRPSIRLFMLIPYILIKY